MMQFFVRMPLRYRMLEPVSRSGWCSFAPFAVTLAGMPSGVFTTVRFTAWRQPPADYLRLCWSHQPLNGARTAVRYCLSFSPINLAAVFPDVNVAVFRLCRCPAMPPPMLFSSHRFVVLNDARVFKADWHFPRPRHGQPHCWSVVIRFLAAQLAFVVRCVAGGATRRGKLPFFVTSACTAGARYQHQVFQLESAYISPCAQACSAFTFLEDTPNFASTIWV